MLDAPSSSYIGEERGLTVHIVEDDHDLRNGLDYLLDSMGLPHRVYDSPASFQANFSPDGGGCIVLDIRMPGLSGIDLVKWLRNEGVRLPLIMMTAHADVPVTIQAFKLGVVEFLLKPFQTEQFLAAITSALASEQRRMAAMRESYALRERLASLSSKDWEVIDMVRRGWPNKRIAAELRITERAVEMRRSSLLKKADVSTFAALIELVTRYEWNDQP